MLKDKLYKRIFRKLGIDIQKYTYTRHPIGRRIKLIQGFNIDHVIDIGANIGQYGSELRSFGYRGKISSFEPIKSCFDFLLNNSKNDELWSCYNYAIGNKNGTEEINVSDNLVSSSIKNITSTHTNAAGKSKVSKIETIEIVKLDSIYNTIVGQDKSYLKIDTQGYEQEVLDGGLDSLNKITGIQLEMSLEELYEGQALYIDLIQYMREKGFDLFSIEPGFSDPITGKLLQMDGVFYKS